MKTNFKVFALFCALGTSFAQANLAARQDASFQRTLTAIQVADLQATATNLINWKVGDYQKIKIQMLFGSGTGTKEATQDVPAQNAVWLVSEMSILGQRQKTEALISRANGELLKLIVNGKEEDPKNDGEIEIIEQSETQVTVPAGTFDCLYIKAVVPAQGKKMNVELWINPFDVNLDGNLKTVAQTQFGALTISLTEFGSK